MQCLGRRRRAPGLAVRAEELQAMEDTDMATSFSVRVNDEEWTQVPSLVQARAEDKVFMVDSTGAVAFGEGTSGRRPPHGASVTVSYRQGGGDMGNTEVSAEDGGSAASRIEEGVAISLSEAEVPGDGIALARLLREAGGWTIDTGFAPARSR